MPALGHLLGLIVKNIDPADEATLASCTQASRAIRAETLKHIHRHLAIPTRRKILSVLSTFTLAPTSFTIPYHVETCAIGPVTGGFGKIQLNATLPQIIAIFPRLTTLSMHACIIDICPDFSLPLITSCTFRNVCFNGYTVDKWLIHMPNLRKLAIFGSYSNTDDILKNAPLPRHLATIAIGLAESLRHPYTLAKAFMLPAAGLMQWLRMSGNLESLDLETLAIFGINNSTWEGAMGIIEVTKPRLKALFVTLVTKRVEDLTGGLGDFSHIKRLHLMDSDRRILFRYNQLH